MDADVTRGLVMDTIARTRLTVQSSRASIDRSDDLMRDTRRLLKRRRYGFAAGAIPSDERLRVAFDHGQAQIEQQQIDREIRQTGGGGGDDRSG